MRAKKHLALVTDPKPEPAPRPRNLYADSFAAAFTEHYEGDPCNLRRGDFVQLAALVRLYGGSIEMECWQRAVANYFASPRQSYTLAHLCTNFAGYKRCAADRFGKPVEKKTALEASLEQFK